MSLCKKAHLKRKVGFDDRDAVIFIAKGNITEVGGEDGDL